MCCCVPARPGVLGTTFLGMFLSGVFAGILWIEVANAQYFVASTKAALIVCGLLALGTFLVYLLGLIGAVCRKFDVLRVYAYATYAALLLQTAFFPWLVYEVATGTDMAFHGIPLLRVCRQDIEVSQQADCGRVLRESQSAIYALVGLVWFVEVEAAIVVARYLLLLNKERRREVNHLPIIYTSERSVSHVDVVPRIEPKQPPMIVAEREFDPYAEVGHSTIPQSAYAPGFTPEPISHIPRYAPLATDDAADQDLPTSGAPSQANELTSSASNRIQPAGPAPDSDVDAYPDAARTALFHAPARNSEHVPPPLPVSGHKGQTSPTLLERRSPRPLPPLPPPEFPQPSASQMSSVAGAVRPLTVPSYSYAASDPSQPPLGSSYPPAGFPHPLASIPHPPPSSYPHPPPHYSAQLAQYASLLSPLAPSPSEDGRRSGYAWDSQTPSSEARTQSDSASSTETRCSGYGGGLLTHEQIFAEEKQRILREEEQRRAWEEYVSGQQRGAENVQQGMDETGEEARESPASASPQLTVRVRETPAPRPLSIVHEERSEDAMSARYYGPRCPP